MIKLKIVIEPNSKYVLSPLNYSKVSKFDADSILNVQKISSRVIELSVEAPETEILKFSNTGVKYWDDFWTDSDSKEVIDPMIEELILDGSFSLSVVNIFSERSKLKRINLSACESLGVLSIPYAPLLEEVILDRCLNLSEVQFGFNKNIRYLSLENCNLREKTLEKILSGYIPSRNDNALVNLRGNAIPWGNRRIASKIRMLLVNNIKVAWSNNPPESVIPAEMYSNFMA